MEFKESERNVEFNPEGLGKGGGDEKGIILVLLADCIGNGTLLVLWEGLGWGKGEEGGLE